MLEKKIVITEECIIGTGEYVNKLRKAQQNGLIDNIPTATDILVEMIRSAKATIKGIVTVYGITFIKGQDYEIYEAKRGLRANIVKNVGN